jgi:Serine dehydrogenase proteinase
MGKIRKAVSDMSSESTSRGTDGHHSAPANGGGQTGRAEGADEKRKVKTPMFHALHHARYERQERIARIQERSGSKLICFVAADKVEISREDTLGFGDLLHNIDPGTPIDLLLQTLGGDIDAAEKLITMVQKIAGEARLRVIVPDCAKSAGTLMALGADQIMMSNSSELGPIDPQVPWRDRSGNILMHSVNAHLDALARYEKALADNPDDQVARMMLEKLEPGTIELFRNLHNRARALAEQLLRSRMLKEDNWTQPVSELLDTNRWYTHGQVIDAKAAEDMGLNVEVMDPDGECWREIWQLYCLQRVAILDHERLYESDFVSLPMEDSR